MKKLTLLLLTWFVAIAANAVTLSGTVTDQSGSATYDVTTEATISEGVISFSNFLGSELSFDVTCYANGKAANSLDADYYEGSFNAGDFGTATKLYFYGGTSDFSYAESDGVKTLSLSVYLLMDGNYVYYTYKFTLPTDFEVAEEPFYGQPYKLTATVTDYNGTYFTSQDVDMTIYINGNVINIPNYLGGGQTITYTLSEDGTSVSGGVPEGYTALDFTGGETNFNSTYGYGTYAAFDADTRAITDSYFVYTTAGNYTANTWVNVSFTLPTLLDATATVKGSSASFKVPYTLGEDGVITLAQIFGTTQSPTFTIRENGVVSNDVAKGGYYNGVLGELGDYEVYIANDSYFNQTYANNDGVQTLSLTTWEYGGSQPTIVITLPSDFTPAASPYYGEPVALTATIVSGDDGYGYGTKYFEDQKVNLTAYVEGNDIIITNYLGGSSVITYTIAEDGTISGGVPAGYTYTDYTVGDNNFYAISSYGKKATYDAETRTVTDEYYIYVNGGSAYSYFKVSFVLPNFAETTATFSGESSTFKVAYTLGEDGEITFPSFLGTSLSPTFTITETGSVSNNLTNTDYVASTLGELGDYKLYLSSNSYTTQKYANNDGVQTLSLTVWEGATYGKATIVITLPEDFKVKELEKNAKVYTLSGDPEAETGDPILVHLDYTISGSLVTISKPLSASRVSFPFTMQTDGTVASTYAFGRFTDSYTFNGNTYAALVDDSRSYDVENKVFKWTFGLTNDPNGKVTAYADAEEHYVLYLQLPDDFEASRPQEIKSCTAGIYNTTASGVTYAAVSSTAKVDVIDYESNKVTITTAFDKSVSIGLSWNEAGEVTVDGTFPSQYYTFGSGNSAEYYTSITVNSAKYVKNDADEYFELNITTGEGYYGGAAYENAAYRIYLTKTSTDPSTITIYAYDWDTENDEEGDLESSAVHIYSVSEAGEITVSNLLGSDLDVLFHFYAVADGEEDGEVTTNLKAGTYKGSFSALGSTYTKLTYAGDAEAACWYSEGRSKYAELTVTLSDDEGNDVETIIYFSLPRNGVTYYPARSTFNVEIYNETTSEQGTSITAKGYSEDGTITVSDFAGSGKEFAYTVWEDGVLSITVDGVAFTKSNGGGGGGRGVAAAPGGSSFKLNNQDLEGSFALGDYNVTKMKVTALSYGENPDVEGQYRFTITGTATLADDDSSTPVLDINLIVPEDYSPKEYERNATRYDYDGENETNATPIHIDATITSSTVTIANPLGITNLTFPFVMQTDGTVACTYATGYYTRNGSYNDYTYGRFFDKVREYNAETKQFRWVVALDADATKTDFDAAEVKYVIYVQLPEDFEATRPAVTAELPTELVSTRNGIEFVRELDNSTVDEAYLEDENTLKISTFMGKSVSLSVTWDANGDGVATGSTSANYFNIGDSYFRAIAATEGATAKYVKNDVDEYVDVPVTFSNEYYGADNLEAIARLYIVKGSESTYGDIISIYATEYDDNDEEVNDSVIDHYYTIDGSKLTIKNFLDSDLDLEITYYDDNTVVTNLKDSNDGTYYAFGNSFSSLNYEGDDVENVAGWYVSSYGEATWLYITLGDNTNFIEIVFYTPDGLSYEVGVNDILANDDDAEVEYFNLQGIRINNPENGIYIRRQGKNVSKVLVK